MKMDGKACSALMVKPPSQVGGVPGGTLSWSGDRSCALTWATQDIVNMNFET